jgi:phosphotransferase system HPr (HPr) family protein
VIQRNIVLDLPNGLQAKKAAEFVAKASSFASNVLIIKNEKKIEAKSIMGVMSAALRYGEEIALVTDGYDELEAMKVLAGILCHENS